MRNEVNTLNVIAPVFWDVDMETLSWEEHRDFIVQRILSSGSQEMLVWLMKRIDEEDLASFLLEWEGAGLPPRRLRFWEVILGLPGDKVDAWVDRRLHTVWEQRVK